VKKLNDIFFNQKVVASVKYDGTNVGKNAETGALYGRNKRIPPATKYYQKAALKDVEEIDAKAVKESVS
jgi:hypothetical protein